VIVNVIIHSVSMWTLLMQMWPLLQIPGLRVIIGKHQVRVIHWWICMTFEVMQLYWLKTTMVIQLLISIVMLQFWVIDWPKETIE